MPVNRWKMGARRGWHGTLALKPTGTGNQEHINPDNTTDPSELEIAEGGNPTHYLRRISDSDPGRGVNKISQPHHLAELLRQFILEDAKSISIPMDPGTYNALFDEEPQAQQPSHAFIKMYQSAIGGIMYIAM